MQDQELTPSALDACPNTAAAPAPGPLLSSPNPEPASAPPFPRSPGETPRAFSAFMTFFDQGHARSLQAVADQLGELLSTVKNWSSRHRWSERIQACHSGLLQRQLEAEAQARQQRAADWARRTDEHREREWMASQKLLGTAECFLESYGDRELEKMNLGQVSHALQIASRLARLALSAGSGPEEPSLSPLQTELSEALRKVFAQPSTPSHQPSTPTRQP